jgi:ArsR family transcriptional regulator, arsenate/arsenite/antimonite-responsive transcriptional repressor
MALSKKDEFSEQEIVLADLAKAISHPARIAILKVLASRNTCMCGEIVEELPLSQSTVSQHLKALKDAELIQGEIDGPKVCYCIDMEGLSKISKFLNQFLEKMNKSVENRKKCC